MVRDYHKLESGRHTQIGACGHRSEARSSVAERCPYMAEEGVRILPRLPGRPVTRVNERGVAVNSLLRTILMVALAIVALSVAACSSGSAPAPAPAPLARTPDNMNPGDVAPMDQYVIGSGDSLSIFVYRNPDLNTYGFLNVREDFAKRYPETVARVLKVYETARHYALDHPDELRAALVKAAKLSDPVAAKELERTDISDSTIGDKQRQAIVAAGGVLKESGVMPADTDAAEVADSLIDPRFVRQLSTK